MSPDAPVSACDTDFSGMGIYVDGRVKNELDELLVTKPASELTARDVHLLASMHYLDDQPMLKAAAFFGLTANADADASDALGSDPADDTEAVSPKTILDFGAGFAGDARCLASEYSDVKVTCLEVQQHIHDAAEAFTKLIGVEPACVHVCLDVFEGHGDEDGSPSETLIAGAPFDFLYSVLAVLHVPRRDALWGILNDQIKPGGLVYVEDYFAANALTDLDKKQLEGPVACPYLPTRSEYIQTLHRAGFEDVRWENTASEWIPFIAERLEAFRANEERNLRVHGPDLTRELEVFYSTVHELFTRGNVGGVRIRARRKA